MQPLTVAIAHSKGGVGKTTTTMVVGKYLARDLRVALKDYDDTRQLSDLVRSMTGDDDYVMRNLRLIGDEADGVACRRRKPDVILIDAEPARGPRTWQALREAEFVLVPAPPEGLAVRAMRQMFDTIQLVRQQVNPFLTIMGVIPTMYDRRWPEHRAFLEEMRLECEEAGVRLFAPVARRQSYLYLSTRGQDYKPVADAIACAVKDHTRVGDLVGRSRGLRHYFVVQVPFEPSRARVQGSGVRWPRCPSTARFSYRPRPSTQTLTIQGNTSTKQG